MTLTVRHDAQALAKALAHRVLRRVPVASTHQDGEQALIFEFAVELGEVQSLGSQPLSTRSRFTPVTWLEPMPTCRSRHDVTP